MVDGTMILHSGGNDVSIEELKEVPVPEPTRSWHPIGHHRLVRAVKNSLDGNFYNIREERHGIKGDRGQQYFGVLHLENKINEDMGLSIGLRNSTDRSLSAGVVFGEQVFVCDNLVFGGGEHSWKTVRKHTRRILQDLPGLVNSLLANVGSFLDQRRKFAEVLKDREISDSEMNDLLIKAVDERAITWQQVPKVLNVWRTPHSDRPDWSGNPTAWRAFNCFTWTMKDGFDRNGAVTANRSIELNRVFQHEFVEVS